MDYCIPLCQSRDLKLLWTVQVVAKKQTVTSRSDDIYVAAKRNAIDLQTRRFCDIQF